MYPPPPPNLGATDQYLCVCSGGFYRRRRVEKSTQKGRDWRKYNLRGK
jgi:hypothetical protein